MLHRVANSVSTNGALLSYGIRRRPHALSSHTLQHVLNSALSAVLKTALSKEETQVGAPTTKAAQMVDHNHHDVTSGRRTDPIFFISLRAAANRQSEECCPRLPSPRLNKPHHSVGLPVSNSFLALVNIAWNLLKSLVPFSWNRGHSPALTWYGH